MRPSFTLSRDILRLVSEISLLLGRYEGLHAPVPQPKLRKLNRVRTIQDSLAVEGNTLDLRQVTAIFEDKRVVGSEKEIREIRNAVQLYEFLPELKPAAEKDLLRAHRILMAGLAEDAGKYRLQSVGILKGQRVSHLAPPAKQLPRQMGDLFDFLKSGDGLSPLVQACVFHYELEFIHPFSDGNGRIGRFWQSLILARFHRAFEYIPVETLVRERHQIYYRTLERCDKRGDSTEFIEFSLETVRDALSRFLEALRPEPVTAESRLELSQAEFKRSEFSRKDYLQLFKTISPATASRDLASGFSRKRLTRTGSQATARYRFKP